MSDIYQQRYLAHIQRKKQVLALGKRPSTCIVCIEPNPEPKLPAIIKARHSQRTFNSAVLTNTELHILYEAARLAPSSCNRQAIMLKSISDWGLKQQLDDWLVGGRHWIGEADTILLLFADMAAYKSPFERDFMPWLDAAFVASNICLAATGLGVGACFVNPNIRQANKSSFDMVFNPRDLLFCGAVALGNYGQADIAPPKRELKGIFY